MRIVSHNEKGQKEIIEYTKRVVEQEPPADEIVIESYEQFKTCIQKSQEQQKYVGGGNQKYARALNKLVIEHHDLYEKFYAKLREEYNESR